MIDICAALSRAGHQALVISEGGRLEGELTQAGGTLCRLPVASKNILQIHRNVRAIEQVARDHDADLIHAHSRAPAWSAHIAARNLGLPFITTYHGAYSEGLPLKRQYNAIMAKGDRIIAPSQFVAARVQRLHKTPRDRLRIIHPGVNPDRFSGIEAPDVLVNTPQGAGCVPDPGTDRIILMPGRMTRLKGQILMLEAFAAVRRTFPRAKLVMPGDLRGRAKYGREIQASIHRLQLEDQVWLPGHIDDLRPFYAMASVVVSASTQPESFGLVAIEAQACARPVVAAGHGGALETVQDGKSGLLFTPGSRDDLARKLVNLLSWPGTETDRMGEAGQAHVMKNFTLEKMCGDTLAVYGELL